MTTASAQEPLRFEEALARLEEIVESLETGELGLEESLRIFEEGVALSRRCQGDLARAERRIEVLVEEAGEIRTEPFATDGAE